MSNKTYNIMWNEAMTELDEQVHIEDSSLDLLPHEQSPPLPPKATITEAFQHFACLYIKYLQIMQKLEECYDALVHPQKRIEAKMVLELVIRRVIGLKHSLVRWNPPKAEIRFPSKQEEAFPWEYVNLDDILVDLKLPPETLDVPVPRYFREDNAFEISERNKLIAGFMRLHLAGISEVLLEENEGVCLKFGMSVDRAIAIIQKNERGRQGYEKALLVKEWRLNNRKHRTYASASQIDMDPDVAAAKIQRIFRGIFARRRAMLEREEELVYIGMKPPSPKNSYDLERQVHVSYKKLKQRQLDYKLEYQKALIEMRDVVSEDEGPCMRESLREERSVWVTGEIAQDRFPDGLAAFYLMKNPPIAEPLAPKLTKKEKGKSEKEKGKKAEKKSTKMKEKPKSPTGPPPLQGKSELTDAIYQHIKDYKRIWECRDEESNFLQQHDVEMTKEKIRPGVLEEMRLQVDEMLIMNLKKIKMQLGKGGKAKKEKKPKKPKKKKDKKKKALPGDKLSEMRGLSLENMIGLLIKSEIIAQPRPWRVSDLVGDFNYLGTVQQHAEQKKGKWVPPDPSMAQLRQLITEYCILPNGSSIVKSGIPTDMQVKSVMLYGAGGTGKTMIVQAIANELGGLIINLSPGRLKGIYGGKTGPTKLIHMAFTVARERGLAPVVIYIDGCEEIFARKAKKGKGVVDKEGPIRFKKDLNTYRKLCLQHEDRVIIVGTSNKPEIGDPKELRKFFDKFIFMPLPDYSSRLMIWKKYISQMLRSPREKDDFVVGKVPQELDIGTLSRISEGYSGGSIKASVSQVITPGRIQRLESVPLTAKEFVSAIALQSQLTRPQLQAFEDFTIEISGLKDRRTKVQKAENEEKLTEEKGKKTPKTKPK